MKKGKLMSKTKETQGTPNPHGDPRHIDDDDQANCPCKTCRHYEAVNRRTHDPRRKLIDEAMEARAALGADPPAEVTIKADCEQDARMVGPTVRFIVAAHNALIAAIREQRAEVVEWEARYGAACRDIGKLSFMRDSDKALHEAAEAEVNRLKAEVERHKAEKLHLIRQLQSIARHSAEHGTKSRVSVALSEVNYD